MSQTRVLELALASHTLCVRVRVATGRSSVSACRGMKRRAARVPPFQRFGALVPGLLATPLVMAASVLEP
jgi:hypothetical protein